MTLLIGIDGGGTKTAAALSDAQGNLLAQTTVGPTNPNGSRLETVQEQFERIREALQPFITDWKCCVLFAGIAGTNHQETYRQVLTCMKRAFPELSAVTLAHDGMNALGSVTFGEAGIVQISGTGAMTFGLDERGERVRLGGWGYLLGDEGSGYDLGRQALVSVMRAYDGRGPKTVLTELALNKWQVKRPGDLLSRVYSPSFKQTIASFSFELFQAHRQGDDVAHHIVNAAADELSLSIVTAINSLYFEGTVLVGLVGGAFQRPLIEAVKRKVTRVSSKPVQMVRPSVEPVIGALVWASKHAGLHPRQLFQKNVHQLKKIDE